MRVPEGGFDGSGGTDDGSGDDGGGGGGGSSSGGSTTTSSQGEPGEDITSEERGILAGDEPDQDDSGGTSGSDGSGGGSTDRSGQGEPGEDITSEERGILAGDEPDRADDAQQDVDRTGGPQTTGGSDISRQEQSIVGGRTSLSEQGVESGETQSGNEVTDPLQSQAQSIQRQLIEEDPNVRSAGDVAVTMQGGELVPQYTERVGQRQRRDSRRDIRESVQEQYGVDLSPGAVNLETEERVTEASARGILAGDDPADAQTEQVTTGTLSDEATQQIQSSFGGPQTTGGTRISGEAREVFGGRVGTEDDDGMDIPDEAPQGQFGGQVTRAPNDSTIDFEGVESEPDTLEAIGAAGSEITDFLRPMNPAELGEAITGPPGTIESSLGDAAFYVRDVSAGAADVVGSEVAQPVGSFLGEGAERFVAGNPSLFGAEASEQATQGVDFEEAPDLQPDSPTGVASESFFTGVGTGVTEATVGFPAGAVEMGDLAAGAGEFTFEAVSEEGAVEGATTAGAAGAGFAASAGVDIAEQAMESPFSAAGIIGGGIVGGIGTGVLGSRAFTAARGRLATRGMDFQDEIPIENIERPDVRQGSGLTRLSERAAPEGGLAMPESQFPVQPASEPVTEIRRLAAEFDDPRIRSSLDVGPEEYTLFRAVRGVRDDIYEPRSRRPYDPDATFLAPTVARNFLDLSGGGGSGAAGLRLPRPVAATRSLISAGQRETPTIMATAGRVDPLPESVSGRADLTDFLQEQRNTGTFYAPSRGAQQTVTGESEVFVSAEGAVSTEPMTWRGRQLDPEEMEGTGVVEPGETTQFVQAADPFVTEIRGERVPIQLYRQDTGDVTPLGQQGTTLPSVDPFSSGAGIRQFLSDERGQLGGRGGTVDVDAGPYEGYSTSVASRLGYDYQPGGAPGTPVYPTFPGSGQADGGAGEATFEATDATPTSDASLATTATDGAALRETFGIRGTDAEPTYPQGSGMGTIGVGSPTRSPSQPTDPTVPTTPDPGTPPYTPTTPEDTPDPWTPPPPYTPYTPDDTPDPWSPPPPPYTPNTPGDTPRGGTPMRLAGERDTDSDEDEYQPLLPAGQEFVNPIATGSQFLFGSFGGGGGQDDNGATGDANSVFGMGDADDDANPFTL